MKIDVDVGVTIRIGSLESNQYCKMAIAFREIDPSLDVEEQLAQGTGAAEKAFALALERLRAEIREVRKEVHGGNVGQPAQR